MYTQITASRFRTLDDSLELECLRQFLVLNDDFLGRVNEALSQHENRSRKRPMTDTEFWKFFAIWLFDQVKGSLSAAHVELGPMEVIRQKLEASLSEARLEALRAAITMDEATFRTCVDDFRTRCYNICTPGKLLTIDETIISSESGLAAHLGFLRYIPGKPYEKGYFCHFACVKLLLSNCVFVLDAEFKWGFVSLSMTDSALVLVHRLEREFGDGFVVICNSGYAAGRLLGAASHNSSSRYICSVSGAKVSGAFRMIVEKANSLFKIGHRVVWHNVESDFMAVIRRTAEYTICLITNCQRPVDETELEPPARPLSYKQAFAIFDNFSVPEMVRLLSFPQPIDSPNRSETSHPIRYLKRVTGIDLASPLDAEGFVTKATLTPLSINHVKAIAEEIGINKQHGKQELISRILKKHPKAERAEETDTEQSEDDDLDDLKAAQAKVTSLKRQVDELRRRLSPRAPQPQFEEMYLANYGLEDRWNSDLYATFRHQTSKNPEQKAAWLFFYMCLSNARSLRHELILSKQPRTPTKKQSRIDRQTLGRFCLEAFKQLATELEI